MPSKMTFLGISLVLIGSILGLMAILMGQVTLMVVFLFPVLVTEAPFGVLSIVLISLGIVLIIIGGSIARSIEQGNAKESQRRGERKRPGQGTVIGHHSYESGGIVFIGPIPIIIGGRSFKKGLLPFWMLIAIGSFMMLLFVLIVLTMTFHPSFSL